MNIKRRLAWQFMTRLIFLLLIWMALFGAVLFILERGVYESRQTTVSVQGVADATTWTNGRIEVSNRLLKSIQENHMWLQILNGTGKVIYSYNPPASLPNQYSPGELISYYTYPAKLGYRLSSWYKEVGGQTVTWVVGNPLQQSTISVTANNVWIISMFLTMVMVAFVFGKQLGGPLLHILVWVQTLSKGSYAEPGNRKCRPVSQTKNGKLKRSFNLYREVIDALNDLTDKLKKSKEERELLEKTREEWMTGISHDIKTPLSTVKGYADMLESPGYHWKEEETRKFAAIIQERSIYMESLIEDFNLTFRLKNNALPLQRTRLNLIEFVREVVIDMANTPYGNKQNLSFHAEEESIQFSFDRKWLLRALENLLANAVNHNPENTNIQVSVLRLSGQGIQISIQDNGVGMDEETKRRLFDRYYRGTNANQNRSGTGLGMAISRQIIESHQGTILVNSIPDKGTEILIRFRI